MNSIQMPPEIPTPAVVKWFKIYCGVLCAMYLLVAACSLPFFLCDPKELETSQVVALVMGTVFLFMGLGLMAACLLPLVLRPRPWLWTYSVVLICLGMTSACFVPVCIPLLIFWLKPDTKSYFGKA